MQRHLIDINSSILDALKRLNELSGTERTLIVIDENQIVRGTLTDGDIRRGLLNNKPLNAKVSEVIHKNFSYLIENAISTTKVKVAREKGITLLPILREGKIVGIHDLTASPTILPIKAILMAGGKGERLRPLTLKTPKPLLKIGEKAIIDYNIDILIKNGIKEIFVTTNYLSDQIEAHFNDSKVKANIKCVKEPQFLGTIGAARLCGITSEGTTLVMNADLLTTVNFEEMYLHHINTSSDVTVASIPYTVSVPFAILETEGNTVTEITEKPTYTYYSNAGIYLISNSLINNIPENLKYDATDLVENAISKSLKVTYFPINGTWIDIGSPDDFRKAQQLMRHFNDLKNN